MPVLFCITVVIWFIGLTSLYRLYSFRKSRKRFSHWLVLRQVNFSNTGNLHYDRLVENVKRGVHTETQIKALFREFLCGAVPELSSGVEALRGWVTVAPLLGLLGTVIGMVETFRGILFFGTGSPAVISQGISIALLTTQAGLLVAIPGLLLQIFLVSRRNALRKQLISDGTAFVNRFQNGSTGNSNV